MIERYRHGILALLIALVGLLNYGWILQDTRPQPFRDPYPEKILEFSDALRQEGLSNLGPKLTRLGVGPRPPLYQLLATPFALLFGRTADAMLLVNLLFGVVLLLATYATASLVGGTSAGLLAAFLAATYPPLVHLTKILRPHSAVPACVALSVWLMARTLKTRAARDAWLAGGSLGFGLLVHPNIIYLLAVPTALWALHLALSAGEPAGRDALRRGLRGLPRRLRAPLILKGVLPGLATGLLLAALWYLPHLERVLKLSELRSELRMGFQEVPYSFWWHARTMPGAISIVLTLLLAGGLLFALVKGGRLRVALASALILMYSGLSWRPGMMGWMNAAALLPVAAVLSALLLDALLRPSPAPARKLLAPLSRLAAAASIGAAALAFSISTWGVPSGERALRAIGSPVGTPTCDWRMNVALCPNPPRQEAWPFEAILATVRQDLGERPRASLSLVSTRLESLSDASLGFERRRLDPDLDLRILPIDRSASRDSRLSWLTSRYVLYAPGFARQTGARAVVAVLEDPPPAFAARHAEIGSFPLPGGFTAKLLARTGRLTLKEAEACIGAARLPRRFKQELLEIARARLETG